MRFKDEQVLTIEKLSPRMEKTPEGFLLCKDVPISRTGTFDYSETESGIKGIDGIVKVDRTAEELFNSTTMQSFEGKPVVIGHSSFVDPRNWKERSIGVIQNVRQGQGDESSMLLADLLLTDARGIRLVESGRLREVSCGYDANPVEDGIGRGHQVGIVGNHVALVQKGRCGNACKIRDGEMKTNIKTILRRMFKDGDEEKFNETLDGLDIKQGDEEPTEEKSSQLSPEERLAVLEHQVAELTAMMKAAASAKSDVGDEEKTADEDEEKQTSDEDDNSEDAPVADECAAETLDEAEELCPGMKRPTGDAKGGKFTAGQMARVKRMALKGAGIKEFGDAATLDGAALDTAFKAAVMLKRSGNNPRVKKFGDSKGASSGRMSNADLNKHFADFWKNK